MQIEIFIGKAGMQPPPTKKKKKKRLKKDPKLSTS